MESVIQTARNVYVPDEIGFVFSINGVAGVVYGGQYRKYEPGQRRLVGINMAAEIHKKSDFHVKTKDFSVPDVDELSDGIVFALTSIKNGCDVYVGCMGGTGRTGLFLAVLAKVVLDLGGTIREIDNDMKDPIFIVRSLYRPHAVETMGQEDYVRDFDTSDLVEKLYDLFNPKVRYITEVVNVPVEVKVPMTFKEYVASLFKIFD